MKALLIVVFTLFVSHQAMGQIQSVSVGYIGPYGVEPGVSISTKYSLGNKTQKADSSVRFFSLDPVLAFYSRKNNHTNGMFNLDFMYNKWKPSSNWRIAPKVGVGYVFNSEVEALTVDFSGKIKGKDRTSYSYFMGNIGFELTRKMNKKLALYFKPSFSYLMSSKAPDTGLIFVDLGVKYSIIQK